MSVQWGTCDTPKPLTPLRIVLWCIAVAACAPLAFEVGRLFSWLGTL